METLTLDESQKKKVTAAVSATPIFQALKPELIPGSSRWPRPSGGGACRR